MKRIGNIYDKICNMDNLLLADIIARKNKAKQSSLKEHDKNREANIIALHEALKNKTYKTSPYQKRTIYEPKEREISILPYIDRVAQHAAMIHIETIFTRRFLSNSYSSIKGKGIHAALWAVQGYLKDVPGTTYCLKFDIQKFYPSVKHNILKQQLRRLFKDQDLLDFLDGIIDSAPGLPIGNYLSQYFANYYLTGLDRYIKQELKVKYFVRYADDFVILSDSKPHLHEILAKIRLYLSTHLNLTIKGNYQVFPVAARSINFVGYKIYHTHTLLRPSIKKRFARAVKRRHRASIASYKGWAKHCNSRHLVRKLLPNESI